MRNLNVCSINWSSVFAALNPPPPTFLTSNCRFISFTVSLATLAERPKRFHQETECGNGVIIYCMAKVLIFTGMRCSLAPLFHVYFSLSHQKVHNYCLHGETIGQVTFETCKFRSCHSFLLLDFRLKMHIHLLKSWLRFFSEYVLEE